MSWQTTRVDGNHSMLLKLARSLGGVVVDTHLAGNGAPDAFVWTFGHGWLAVEIKSGRGKLRQAQSDLAQQCPVVVWRTEADVLASFGVTR